MSYLYAKVNYFFILTIYFSKKPFNKYCKQLIKIFFNVFFGYNICFLVFFIILLTSK